MQTKRVVILILLAALAAVIFVLNQLAVDYYLYWVYWWYDIMMHFLGGCLIGGLAMWALHAYQPNARFFHGFLVTVCAIIIVGVGWEVFEYLTGSYIGQTRIVLDTSLDLVLDVLGALCVGSIVHWFLLPASSETI